jgi:hypothetical protein
MHVALQTEQPEKLNFFRIYGGTLMISSVLYWWRYFGNRSEDSHWTKLLPVNEHVGFRNELEAALHGQPVENLQPLWNDIEAMRNRGFAHHDFDLNTRPRAYPFLGPLRATAEVLYLRVFHELDHYNAVHGLARPEHFLGDRRTAIILHWQEIVAVARDATSSYLDSPWDFKLNGVPMSEQIERLERGELGQETLSPNGDEESVP